MPYATLSDHVLPRVAIVEDDEILTFLFKEICQSAGYEIAWQAANVADALLRLGEDPPDVVLLDFALEGKGDGIEILSACHRDHPEMSTILTTGWDRSRLEARIDYVAPDHVLQKPIKPADLADVLEVLSLRRGRSRLAHAA